ncbi:MAG: SLC13 family permease [Phycisphaerae bacterium]
MGWEAWFTLAVIAVVCGVLVRGIGPPDMVLWGGTVVVTIVPIIGPADAISGFASESVLTIAALFVIAAGMRETGALDLVGGRMLGAARTERGALLRMIPQVTAVSAFLANTAVVAMLIPVLSDWCRRLRVSPARLLLPLSFLSILGGMCTLIGTTTNLIVSDIMQKAQPALAGLSMFELAWIGVPCVLIGAAYLLLVAPRLLPARTDMLETIGKSVREYLVEMSVQPHCPLVGKSVEAAGLRRLPGLFLVEIVRDHRVIAPVEPDEVLLAGDQLAFAGVVETIVDLERIPGLVPVTEADRDVTFAERRNRRYCEAVVSGTSMLVARNIRAANFRALYNAAVIAVHRGGERLVGRIGDIVLRAGDTLLLQTGPHFAEANRNNPDFYLVSSLEQARPVRHERTWIALGLLALLVVLLVFGGHFGVRPVVAAFLVAGLMMLTGCISIGDARRAVNLDVLLTIAAAFGLGKALEASGAATALGDLVVYLTGQRGAIAALALVYVVTIALGILITSKAAAVLVFPIAMVAATQLDVDPRPFAIVVASAAASSFASPISYQTNMMVYGPGGYRFTDFLRVGLPLHLMLWIVALIVIPLVWPP